MGVGWVIAADADITLHSMKSLVQARLPSVSRADTEERSGAAKYLFPVPRKRAARHRGRVKAFPKVSLLAFRLVYEQSRPLPSAI